jgi:hypothetical protein
MTGTEFTECTLCERMLFPGDDVFDSKEGTLCESCHEKGTVRFAGLVFCTH